MKTYLNDMIEYKIETPLNYDVNTSNFTSFSIDKIITLEPFKPPIDAILKVQVTSSILSNRKIKTPRGTSLEGFSLTGFKSVVMGEYLFKIQYTSYNNSVVYSFSYSFPFIEYIVLNENNFFEQIYPYTIIEDVLIEKIDDYNLSLSSSLLCLL